MPCERPAASVADSACTPQHQQQPAAPASTSCTCSCSRSYDPDAVVEALVREHLTKKQHTQTLAAFKQEQGTPHQPINKRSILQEILGLKLQTSTTGTAATQQPHATAALSAPPHGVNGAALAAAAGPAAASPVLKKSTSSKGSSGGSSSSSTLELLVQQLLQERGCGCCRNCNSNTKSNGSSINSGTAGSVARNVSNRQQQGWGLAGEIPAAAGVVGAGAAGVLAAPSVASQRQAVQQPLPHQQQQQQQQPQRRLPAMTQPPQLQSHQPQQQQQQADMFNGKTASTTTASATVSTLQKQVEDLVIDDVDFDADSATAAQHSTTRHASSSSSTGGKSWAAAGGGHLNSLLAAGSRLGTTTPTTAGGGAGVKLAASSQWQPLAPEQQRQLVQLVWGDGGVQPEASWQQGLLLSEVQGLEWGLVQLAGGPCGVLAAVQAHLIGTLMEQQLWHPAHPQSLLSHSITHSSSSGGGGGSSSGTRGWAGSSGSSSSKHLPTVPAAAAGGGGTAGMLSQEQLQDALIDSLALMLWTCATSSNGNSSGDSSSSSKRSACVVTLSQQSSALCGSSSSASTRGLCDAGQVLREAQVATAVSLEETQSLVRCALPQWCQRKGWGVLLLVYSSLLSRTCAGVRSDMDSSLDTRLVDSLGYCSMELVNLLLTGTAVSNVFDGCQVFGAGAGGGAGKAAGTESGGAAAGEGEEELVIKGVMQRSGVGLLTLFEWYRYVEVGRFLKSPRLPVWVVCSESHFSVLALCWCGAEDGSGVSTQQAQSCDMAALVPSAQAPLLLQYYDGLAKQQGPVVLEVLQQQRGWSSRMAGVAEERGMWQGRPIPPLECVLETKWPDVGVCWHGSEPIL